MEQRAVSTRQKAETRLDVQARQHGHGSVAELFASNRDKRLTDIAAVLGISDRYASELERRYLGRTGGRREPVRNQETVAAGYAKRSEGIRRKHRAEWDRKASEAGYPDIRTALASTSHWGATRQAALLKVYRTTIYYMRRELANQPPTDSP